MFRDRKAAGIDLAKKLTEYRHDPGIVLAVPRGGVPVAYAVAKELDFPMDLVLTKKIGHPLNREYAIGAASLTDYFVVPHDDVSDEYIEKELLRVRTRLKEMQVRFRGDRAPEKLEGKTVIIVDDGIATGNTILGTVRLLKKSHPAKIIIAVPVASRSAIHKLSKEADAVISLLVPTEFFGVGAFYENFEQVSDEEVDEYLDKFRQWRKMAT
ncbi:phosphoribosyltransferase [Flavihumibacter fluvii]|uniref:phosphoribosyltransferase n=1 Tax=Flavihumibacter fluvii TaxID=2838157 RepID=UPI001BDF0854|nr:phosphoribosyltransferase family protein [Flavihumibacter fluvii]ULQ53320.1 phosphoribosyltransferase [Flavihumibacter fluvii]